MTIAIVTDIESLLAKLKEELTPAATVVVNDAEAIGSSAWTYIKANGLQDLYQIALSLVAAALPGASWAATLAEIEAKAVADGKQIVSGASALVAAQAQADLIAAGKLIAPAPAAPAEPQPSEANPAPEPSPAPVA